MKYAIIADTHLGVRNDNQHFLDSSVRFHEKLLFPAIKEHKIDAVLHCGDLVDRKRGISYVVAETLRKRIIEPLASLEVPVIVACGNHDAPFDKHSTATNALNELIGDRYPTFTVHNEPTIWKGWGHPLMVIPWICASNYNKSMETMEKIDRHTVLFGHLELNGFKMYKTTPECSHGLDAKILKNAKRVFSGHFHTPSDVGDVHYVGAPYEMNWHDYNDWRGFLIYDTDKNEITRIQNTDTMFAEIEYVDVVPKSFNCQGKIVKVIVNKRDDIKKYDKFMLKLNEAGPLEIIVKDETMKPLNEAIKTVDVTSSGDILSTIKNVVEEVDGVDKVSLLAFMNELYKEASENV